MSTSIPAAPAAPADRGTAAVPLRGRRALLKRWLYLVHRWAGVAVCLFFAMWFISGVVMMYVGYPKLTPAERLAHLPVVDGHGVVSPADAAAAAGVSGTVREIRLANGNGGRAIYTFTLDASVHRARAPGRAEPALAVDAATGKPVGAISIEQALASARSFAPGAAVRHLGEVDENAYTHSRALDPHRPLHAVQLDDADDTRLYVSGRTGEVVRDATGTERRWNWVGAWIHWLYPFRGNVFEPYYTDIMIGACLAGIALTLTGVVVGLLRWRFGRPYATGRRSPYRGLVMRWHHVFGLLFAAVTFTWILSGLLSINPWKVFDSGAPRLAAAAYAGGSLDPAALTATPAALAQAAPGARELTWVRHAGELLVLAQGPGARPRVLDARTAEPVALDPARLRAAVARLVPAGRLVAIDELRAFDAYYYARAPHTMLGHVDKPLPVWRARFDDPHETWVHVDPYTGALLGRLDDHGRVKRWLFAFLHSWDWLPLLDNRPLWDVVLIALSIGGTVLSVTGVIGGWRRLTRKFGREQRA